MTIDGFLGCLGLVVAIFALASPVARYRLRLQGAWLWFPSILSLIVTVYLLLFNEIGLICKSEWCQKFELDGPNPLNPNKLAFVLAISWLCYVAALSKRTSVGPRQIPVLSQLVNRLALEKRNGELVDFVAPHIDLIVQTANRQLFRQNLLDRIRNHGRRNPYLELMPRPVEPSTHGWQKIFTPLQSALFYGLKPLVAMLPSDDEKETSAKSILRVLYLNKNVVEYVCLERPMIAISLMKNKSIYDYDYSDKAFKIMTSHGESQLNIEISLNQSTKDCFYFIDPQNQIIHALFSDTKVAEDLEVYRPIGNHPIELLDENTNNYREVISQQKPRNDDYLWRDPSYRMIFFFDIMVRSAMRDKIEWHMWLFYFNYLTEKIVGFMDHSHPEYDPDKEFPNFGYYLIYEIFSTYGSWLDAARCCPEDSPAIQVKDSSPNHDNGSILKSTILSIGQSLRYLIESKETSDEYISYILEIIFRRYRRLSALPNGKVLQEALLNSLISRGVYGLNPEYGDRLRYCFAQVDHMIRFEVPEFEQALQRAYP